MIDAQIISLGIAKIQPHNFRALSKKLDLRMNTWQDYLCINNGYKEPYIFKLTNRGLYSEINCLAIAMMYALHKQRRLLVDTTHFQGGVHWSDLFSTALPELVESLKIEFPQIESLDLHKIRKFAHLRNDFMVPVRSGRNHRLQSVFSAKSTLAKLLHVPNFPMDFPTGWEAEAFCALQIRRGDKIEGYQVGSKIVIEGSDVSVESLVQYLGKYAVKYENIFVLTDDYQFFAQLRDQCPEKNFLTFCPKGDSGYNNNEFQKLSKLVKLQALQRLVSSVHVAGRADFFIGPFTSNPARVIPLLQGSRKRCQSTDKAGRWKAN